MPFGRLGIDVHGRGMPPNVASKLVFIKSSCKPTLNTLHAPIPVLKGPGAVLFIPSGKNGQCKNPPARSVNATEPSSLNPSAAARSTYDPKPAPRKRIAALELE